MFFGISSKIALGLGIALVAVSGAFYFYWNYSQDKIASLNEQNGQLKVSLKTQKDTILDMQEKHKAMLLANKKLQKEVTENGEALNRLSNMFRSHDVEKLAKKRPETLERLINKANRNFWKNLGKDLELDEKNLIKP